ncbi:MAG: aldehyde dehydrogenase family protein [Flavobacteriales bacterium]
MNLHSRIQNYIDGQHLDSLSGEFFDNIDPSTGKSYSTIPNSNAQDVELAYQAAKKAFPVWSRMEEKEFSGQGIQVLAIDVILNARMKVHRAKELRIVVFSSRP